MIPRLLEELLIFRLTTSDKILLLYGARQVGKTTLVQRLETLFKAKGKRTLYLNCDIDEEKKAVDTTSRSIIEQLVKNIDMLFIDEAQGLTNPGLTLKNIHVIAPQVKILATGSSSFELKNKLSDPLTGRYLDFELYPLSLAEILNQNTLLSNQSLYKNTVDSLIPSILLYGLYPAIFTENNPSEKQILLDKIVESYLFKDMLVFQRIKHSQAIKDLTRALAYQIGSEVNENELANRLKIDRKTVVNYLEILEKSFVILRLRPFSKNPRHEIGKNYKVYFIDLGIRNTLIGDFNPVALRKDAGFLWENFLFIERLKIYANRNQKVFSGFWRNYGGAEVDYIEKRPSQNLEAFEFKYSSELLSKGTSSFVKEYKVKVNLINTNNYLKFLL